MTDLPRRPVPPLDPPAGAFDDVARRARSRRLRSASVASGSALALVAGAVLGAAALSGTSRPVELRFASPSPSGSASEADPTPSAAPEPTPAEGTPSPSWEPSPVAHPVPQATEDDVPQTYLGRLVDPAGNPVAGMRVYAFDDRRDFFGPDLVATSAADGTFVAPCDGRPVLVSSTQVEARDRGDLSRNWAMRFLGTTSLRLADAPALPCSDEVVTTRLAKGAVVQGEVRREWPLGSGRYEAYPDGRGPEFGVTCAYGDVVCAMWSSTNGRYRFVGLPAGTFKLGGMYSTVKVTLTAGQVLERDWWECDGCRDGKPRPAATTAPSASAPAGEEEGTSG